MSSREKGSVPKAGGGSRWGEGPSCGGPQQRYKFLASAVTATAMQGGGGIKHADKASQIRIIGS